MSICTITSKNQMTVPADLRDGLSVKPGDRLKFSPLPDGGFRVEKDSSSFNDLRGIVKIGRPIGDDDLTKAIAEARTAIGSGSDRS